MAELKKMDAEKNANNNNEVDPGYRDTIVTTTLPPGGWFSKLKIVYKSFIVNKRQVEKYQKRQRKYSNFNRMIMPKVIPLEKLTYMGTFQ